MSMEELMLRIETSLPIRNMERSTNNGTSSMLMNIKMSQVRENSMRNSDSTSKDHSTLSLHYHHIDTLISLAITLLSRHQMEEHLKSGTSINNLWQSDLSPTTNHGTFKVMVEAIQCKSQALTPTGGRSSDMKESNSSTGITERHLMFQVERMLKDNQFGSGVSMVEPTRDGRFSILTKHQRFQLKDLTKNTDSTLTDHSTSDQDFQWRDSLRCTETPTCQSWDGIMEERHNSNGPSIKSKRFSETITGRTISLKSNQVELDKTL